MVNLLDMISWLPSIPYQPAGEGYWSPVTSTINWCEEDYYATIYSAEIVNTLTNLLFMYLAFKGIASCIRNDHDRIFLVTYLGYLVVGTGSFWFHATLKCKSSDKRHGSNETDRAPDPWQLVDELSMIYTTCLMCYATFSYNKSKQYSIILAVFLIALAAFITGYYHYLQDPTFHQNAYALLTATVLLRAMYIMETSLRPSLRSAEKKQDRDDAEETDDTKATKEYNRQDRRDGDILKNMWMLIGTGLTIFLSGFGIWALDNVFCSKLIGWRRQIGLPWGILLEGHGWWHIMTGVGAYYYIVWGIWLRHCLNGKHDEYDLVWPNIFLRVPVVVRREGPNKASYQNGSAKKSM
ncbi:dihydroceramidase [Aulographum hederae CBS 113979]|uniref:Dihydroceramidase n=1 Tax=Aulographum hederae CBS 113979 TaxID=1176131 RepID=A0A6G1GVH1_9PEZI|nr:dihydroceramidase [Aulographum hederae CBS 113979]